MYKALNGKYLIHNLTFYKGQQKYGLNYFSNVDEFVKFAPFKLLSKTICEFKDKEFIETSLIFKI